MASAPSPAPSCPECITATLESTKTLCTFYNGNGCTNTRCKFQHKKKLCSFFLKGQCSKGSECRFSHVLPPCTHSAPAPASTKLNPCPQGENCPRLKNCGGSHIAAPAAPAAAVAPTKDAVESESSGEAVATPPATVFSPEAPCFTSPLLVENAELRAENEALHAENAALREDNDALREENEALNFDFQNRYNAFVCLLRTLGLSLEEIDTKVDELTQQPEEQ